MQTQTPHTKKDGKWGDIERDRLMEHNQRIVVDEVIRQNGKRNLKITKEVWDLLRL